MRDDGGTGGGDGLFEVEPVEKRRSQGRGAAVDKRFRTFDPHQVLLLPQSLDDRLRRRRSPAVNGRYTKGCPPLAIGTVRLSAAPYG
ncbi:hypothetical protein OG763_20440 [Streptomyces sp. NBC_01230]|uniref:hypothetical protein n=1 Tax=unclassified Streptomyces TaxID=2593676 RepID=UPI002E13554C|nr:hypothetical protein OG763_20440 [Streptomyces sp. NBC_01230]